MTKQFLRRYTLRRVASVGVSGASGVLGEARKYASGKDVFLSHSHLDDLEIDSVIEFFGDFDASVYRDSDDSALPVETSSLTASTLRERICGCRKFVVAASANLRHSRWVPWELGFADAARGIPNVAILPIAASDPATVAVEQEYLDIYPVVAKVLLTGHDQAEWCVSIPGTDKWLTVSEWLLREQ